MLGADLIIVNDPSSREIFHDQLHPEKFRGLLPVLYDNGHDDVIYAVPRRYKGLARVVETEKLEVAGADRRQRHARKPGTLRRSDRARAGGAGRNAMDGFTKLEVKAAVGRASRC